MLSLYLTNPLMNMANEKNIKYEGGSSTNKKYLLASLLINMTTKEPVVYETGFNVGCSAVILCEAIQVFFGRGKFTSIEIDKSKEPIAIGLKALFPYLDVEVIFENSTTYLPTIVDAMTEKVDLFFVDGGHSTKTATKDIQHALKMLKPRGVLVVDDSNNVDCIQQAINNTLDINKVIFFPQGTGMAVYQKEG